MARTLHTALGQANQPSTDATLAENGQDRKHAFVKASVDRRTTSPDRLAVPASAFIVQAGTVILGALITGIRSDLPGEIAAQVTENVYDAGADIAGYSSRTRSTTIGAFYSKWQSSRPCAASDRKPGPTTTSVLSSRLCVRARPRASARPASRASRPS
jgi:hypothetical protein